MKEATSKNHTGKSSNAEKSDLPRLAAPAERALAAAGIQNLEQLTRFTEAGVRQLHGIGQNALGKLRQALAAKKLSFAGEKKDPGKNTERSN